MAQASFRNNITNFRKGVYLIEFLVALGIFSIIIGALLSLMLNALQFQRRNTENAQASWYAQEGIQALHSIALHGFGKLPIGTFGLSFTGTTWTLSGSQDTQGNLERSITIAWAKRDGNGTLSTTGATDPQTKLATVTIKRSNGGAILHSTSSIATMAMGKEWKETTVADFSSGTFSNTQTASIGDGAIILGQSGLQSEGLRFQLDNLITTLRIRSQTQKISYRFTPTLTQPISQLRVYVATVNGTVPSYRIGLRANQADGTPATSWLGTTSNGFGILAAPFTTGWKTITLNEPVGVPAGQTVHLVIEWASGTISNSRYAAFLVSNPLNLIDPTTGASQNDLQTFATNNGTSWTIQNSPNGYQPIFVAETSTQEYFGNAYTTAAASQIYGANIGIGQRITIGSSDTTIQGARFLVYKNSTNSPADNLHLTIRDLTTNAVLVPDVAVVTAAAVTTTPSWYTVTLPTPVTAQANHVIRLELSSPGSVSSRHYRIQNHASVTAPPYTDLTFRGIQSYLETRTGSTWSASTNADMPFEIILAGGYATSGTYESSIFDTGSASTRFASILWDATSPPGTTVAIKVRTGATVVDLQNSPFVGPDNTSGTTFTSLETIPSPAGGTGTRFIQYQLSFSGPGNDTPQLSDISMLYEP